MNSEWNKQERGGRLITQPPPLQSHSTGISHSPGNPLSSRNQIKSKHLLVLGADGPSDFTSLSLICEMGTIIPNSQGYSGNQMM